MPEDLDDAVVNPPDGPPGPQFLDGLSGVHHHISADDGRLVAVEMRFVQRAVLVQVDTNTDEVLISFQGGDHDCHVDHHGVTRVDVSRADQYREIIGSDALWRWSLVNQQGYRDGFQIELEQRVSDNSTISTATFQYLAMAGQIEIRHIA